MTTLTTTALPRRFSMQQLLRQRLLARMAALEVGAVHWRFAGGGMVTGNAAGPLGTVHVVVDDPAFWTAVALRGALGAGESWVQGHWNCDDPVRLVRMLLRDRSVLDAGERGLPKLVAPVLRVLHALRANTRAGSKHNIAAHYDLGDEFFAAFLDPTMTYSSAVFAAIGEDLEAAQHRKQERLCRGIGLTANDHLLEIGTGWGSMALCAAGRFGATVTTTTISARQFAAAQKVVERAGLGDRVTVIDRDYRDLEGTFDKLVNVEMVEAVGHGFLPRFFGHCARLLRPQGLMAMQAITIADQHYDAALRRVDFIKRYVFPGSFIPSVTALVSAAQRGSDLRLLRLEDFGLHYAATLRLWRQRLHAAWPELLRAGVPESLLRTWDWYFAYCEGGFAERYLSVVQAFWGRPGAVLPATIDAPVLADPYGAAIAGVRRTP